MKNTCFKFFFLTLLILLFGSCKTNQQDELEINTINDAVVDSFKTENFDLLKTHIINRDDLEYMTSLPNNIQTEEYKAWTKTIIDSVLLLGTKLFEESFLIILDHGKKIGINWSDVVVTDIDKRKYNQEGNELLISRNTISFNYESININIEFECAKMESSWKLGNAFKIIDK